MTGHGKVLAVNSFWAKIFTTVFTAGILGGVSFAWNVNAETSNLKLQMQQMQQAALPSRMDKLEQRVDIGFANQERALDKLDAKLDRIEQKLTEDTRERRTR